VIPLGRRRLEFLKETLEDLAGSLKALDIPLYVHVGHPLDVLDPNDRLVFQSSIGFNERRIERDVKSAWRGEWQVFDGFTLYPRDEIP
ncbi:deoxyribodipyrimidine photo-lyase, partial [Acinetobacter soli]